MLSFESNGFLEVSLTSATSVPQFIQETKTPPMTLLWHVLNDVVPYSIWIEIDFFFPLSFARVASFDQLISLYKTNCNGRCLLQANYELLLGVKQTHGGTAGSVWRHKRLPRICGIKRTEWALNYF